MKTFQQGANAQITKVAPKDVASKDCKRNKQVKSFFHSNTIVSTPKFHSNTPCINSYTLDLFVLWAALLWMATLCLCDYGWFSVFYLGFVSCSQKWCFWSFNHYCKRVEKEWCNSIIKIGSDHHGESENDISTTFIFSTSFLHEEHLSIMLCKKDNNSKDDTRY